jgi:hypothetical protein
LNRKHPSVLQVVCLHLPRLADVPGVAADPAVFVQKLPSLARLALSAGTQKRAFLRLHSRGADGSVTCLGRGFLLDRARLLVVPVGLEDVVRRLIGEGLCVKAGLELARQIVQRLRAVVEGEGAAVGLNAGLDGLGGRMDEWEKDIAQAPAEPLSAPANAAEVAGITPWDANSAPYSQVRAAGQLHAAAGGGTAVVVLPAERAVSNHQVADLLHFAWRQTEVSRLRLIRLGGQKQPTLPGLH